MTTFLWGYGLGISTVVAPLVALYVKGFFKEWVKTPVITIEPAGETPVAAKDESK